MQHQEELIGHAGRAPTSSQLMWWWYPTEAIKKLFCHLKLSLDRYHSGADVTVLLGQESGQESLGICIIGQNNSGRRHREFASSLKVQEDTIEKQLQAASLPCAGGVGCVILPTAGAHKVIEELY